MKIKQNQRCVVKQTAPHHANRVGFFQFVHGSSTAVLTNKPLNPRNDAGEYFAVNKNDLEAAPS